MKWIDKHPRLFFIISSIITLLAMNQKEITPVYNKIVGTPTTHKVTKFKFLDKYNTDLTYLNPDTKRAERIWFWW